MAAKSDTSFKKDSCEQKFLSGCSHGKKIHHECEVVMETEGQDSLDNRYHKCSKNPGHEKFIRVKDFKMEDLPRGQRTRETMEDAFVRCSLTVRVKVTYTSRRRPATFADSKEPYPYNQYRGSHRSVRYGTGSIVYIFFHHSVKGKRCPCLLCKNSSNPKKEFWWIQVRTAAHVIHDRSEAETAEIDCFYDSDDRQTVKTIYGFDMCNILSNSSNTYRNDVYDILCVTHDRETAVILNSITPSLSFLKPIFCFGKNTTAPIIVSHPHGCSKRITVGSILHLTVPIGDKYPVGTPILFKKGTVYRKSLQAKDMEANSYAENTDSYFNEKLSNDENGRKLNVNNPDNAKSKVKDDASETHHINFQEKLEGIRTSLKIADVDETLIDLPTNNEKYYSKDDYLVEFYSLFLKEQCLRMILICALVDLRNNSKEDRMEHLTKMALESAMKVFLQPIRDVLSSLKRGTKSGEDDSWKWEEMDGANGSYEATSSVILMPNTNGDDTTDVKPENTEQDIKQGKESGCQMRDEKFKEHKDGCDTVILESQWLELLKKSNEDYQRYVKDRSSNKSTDVSFLVSWYDRMEQVVSSGVNKCHETGEGITEDIVRQSIAAGLKAGYEMLSEIVKIVHNDPDHNKPDTDVDDNSNIAKENKGADNKAEKQTKVYKIGDKQDTDICTNNTEGFQCIKRDDSRVALEKCQEDHDTEGMHSRGDKNDEEADIVVKEGTTFTLPLDSEYAFRVYSSHQGWMNFPPGTEIISPDGNHCTLIGEPSLYEFKHPTTQPELCYVTYDTDTCPGSSGANVYCDILGRYLGNYFPHSGNVKCGVNQSGVRDNMFTLYYKLFCFKPKYFSGSNESSDKSMSIIKTSKALFGSFMKL